MEVPLFARASRVQPDASEVARHPARHLQAGVPRYDLPRNPVTNVERPRVAKRAGIDVFSRDKILRLAAAADGERDEALYLTAAYTGLRLGELLALRWEDIDFHAQTIRVRRNYTAGREGTPKSGRDRAVPMITEIATVLARLGQRERFTSDQDLVFCDELGRHLVYKSLSDRYKAALKQAGLRPLRFHEYADVFVMPTFARKSAQIGLIAA